MTIKTIDLINNYGDYHVYYSASELDLAIKIAILNNHSILHFGINGYFLYSE